MELRSSWERVSRLNLVVVEMMLEVRERRDATVGSSRSRAVMTVVIRNHLVGFR